MRSAILALACAFAMSGCDDTTQTGGQYGIPPVPAQMGPGLYAVGDGTQIYSRTRLNEDGSFTDLNAAMEPVGRGQWRVVGESQVCFDPEGDGADQAERCWENGPIEEDGSFVSTRIDGTESYRVTQLED